MLSAEQQQAHVLSLHDAVVEIKATMNNGLKAQLIEQKAERKSVKDDAQLIRDALGLLLLQALGRAVADLTRSPSTAATSPRSIGSAQHRRLAGRRVGAAGDARRVSTTWKWRARAETAGTTVNVGNRAIAMLQLEATPTAARRRYMALAG